MRNKYYDLIDQTFDFPQDEFRTEEGELMFHDIPLMEIIKQYGTPLKITYLPKISSQIQRAKRMFNVAIAKTDYKEIAGDNTTSIQITVSFLALDLSFFIPDKRCVVGVIYILDISVYCFLLSLESIGYLCYIRLLMRPYEKHFD